MPRQDRHFGWRLKREWFSVKDLLGIDNNGTDDKSLGQGTPTVEPATTIETVCIPMSAADEVHHLIPIPWDLDRTQPMRVRVHFLHTSTDGDDPEFKFGYKFFARQEAIKEIQANADKTVTLNAHACSTTDNSYEVTEWANLGTEDYISDDDIAMGMVLELDDQGGAGADEIELFGFELEYTINAYGPYREKTSTASVSAV